MSQQAAAPAHMKVQRFCHMAAGLLAASGSSFVARAAENSETQQLLRDLQKLTDSSAIVADDSRSQLQIKEIERQIDEAFAAIDRMANGASCYEQAVAYIAAESSDSPGVFAESVELHVIGSYSHRYFNFAAGTSLQAAVEQINATTHWVGAQARIAALNPNRIEIQSSGSYRYIKVKQTAGSIPIIFASALGGNSMFNWTDYGCFVGEPLCAEPATLHLSTAASLMNYDNGSTTLIVQGYRGVQMFTFASGSNQANIIVAINTFEFNVGVAAAQSPANPSRVELRSTFLGEDGFVSVMQVGGTPPIIFSAPTGGTGLYSLFANGLDRVPGDANCDRVVNTTDLILVVQNWGDCPLPPFVCEADVTEDGTVSVTDLLRVINNWGAQG